MVRFLRVLLIMGLCAIPLGVVSAAPRNLRDNETPVSNRCVNAAGTAFVECGGSAATAKATAPTLVDGGLYGLFLDLAGNLRVTLIPVTTGGVTPCYLVTTASTNATNCKNAAGQIYGYDLVNTTATIVYVRLYNLSAAPTCSSATGFIRTIPVLGTGGISRTVVVGEAYGTGIGFCATGGGGSTDNTNAVAGVYITVHYK